MNIRSLGTLALLTLVACSGGEDPKDTSVPADTDTDTDTDTDADTDTDTDTDTAPPSDGVELGTGNEDFVPVDDMDELEVEHGPQGGWHVYGSVRTWGMGDVVTINHWIIDNDSGFYVSDNEHRVLMPLGQDCDGCYEYIGMYGYISVDDMTKGMTCDMCGDETCVPPEVLIGNELTMCVSVEDADGNYAEDCNLIIGGLDPDDAECVP